MRTYLLTALSRAMFVTALAVPLADASPILVGAPIAANSFYGMCCNHQTALAAQFTLSSSQFVTTVDVVLFDSSIFDFSLQNSLTGSITTFGSAVITTPTGQNTESITVNTTLPVGTYYVVGIEDLASNTVVPGWFLSSGTFVTNAGSVANGLWSSRNAGATWVFSSVGCGVATSPCPTPAFAVNGSVPEPFSLLLLSTGLLFLVAVWLRKRGSYGESGL